MYLPTIGSYSTDGWERISDEDKLVAPTVVNKGTRLAFTKPATEVAPQSSWLKRSSELSGNRQSTRGPAQVATGFTLGSPTEIREVEMHTGVEFDSSFPDHPDDDHPDHQAALALQQELDEQLDDSAASASGMSGLDGGGDSIARPSSDPQYGRKAKGKAVMFSTPVMTYAGSAGVPADVEIPRGFSQGVSMESGTSPVSPASPKVISMGTLMNRSAGRADKWDHSNPQFVSASLRKAGCGPASFVGSNHTNRRLKDGTDVPEQVWSAAGARAARSKLSYDQRSIMLGSMDMLAQTTGCTSIAFVFPALDTSAPRTGGPWILASDNVNVQSGVALHLKLTQYCAKLAKTLQETLDRTKAAVEAADAADGASGRRRQAEEDVMDDDSLQIDLDTANEDLRSTRTKPFGRRPATPGGEKADAPSVNAGVNAGKETGVSAEAGERSQGKRPKGAAGSRAGTRTTRQADKGKGTTAASTGTTAGTEAVLAGGSGAMDVPRPQARPRGTKRKATEVTDIGQKTAKTRKGSKASTQPPVEKPELSKENVEDSESEMTDPPPLSGTESEDGAS